MPALESRPLGRTDLSVTRLGFGAMEIRGPRIWKGREVTDEQAERILNAVLDAGVTFVDTAGDYGRSEAYIGRFIAARRGEYRLATKVGCSMVPAGDHDETPHVWTRDHLLRTIDDSLTKLQTDHVDLVQLHNATVADVEQGKLVDVLREMQANGQARYIGASCIAPDMATFIEWGVFDSFQVPYSALERKHERLITRAHEAGAGVIVRGGVAKGEPDRGAGPRADIWQQARLDELLGEGESRSGWLLRFTLSHPGVDTVIVGTLDPDHLQDNVRAAQAGPLPSDVYEEAKRRLDAAGERSDEA